MYLKYNIILTVLSVLFCIYPKYSLQFDTDRFSANSIYDLVSIDGYPLETHKVRTADNYILDLHRIPYGKNDLGPVKGNRPVVLLGHCLYCSSIGFIMLHPEDSLAYKLANEGYDVWMLNVRGSSYSRQHSNFTSDSKEYWMFSFHEHGIYDLPANIDYILQYTGEKDMDYIGFSMGTTMGFILFSEKPEYNKKIRNFFVLAPSAYHQFSRGIFPTRTDFFSVLRRFERDNGKSVFPFPEMDFGRTLTASCSPRRGGSKRRFCQQMIFASGGTDNGNIKQENLPFYFKFFPDYTSITVLSHYGQHKRQRTFKNYDFGRRGNMMRYRSSTPPRYRMRKISCPVHMFYARADFITTKKDSLHVMRVLPNIASKNEIKDRTFSHLDFIWGQNAPEQVYEPIIELLRNSSRRNNFI